MMHIRTGSLDEAVEHLRAATEASKRGGSIREIAELNIGYFMMGEALFVGLGETVRQMRAAMDRGRQRIAGRP